MFPKQLVLATLVFSVVARGQTAFSLEVIKNVPFSAEATTTSTQQLPDGTRIVRQTMAQIARDRDGRTVKKESRSDGNSITFIQDPSIESSYVLDSKVRLAHKIALGMRESGGSALTLVLRTRSASVANVQTENLGFQVIEGLIVPGVRITNVIPQGQEGNDQPIKVVSDAWYSEELKTVLMSKTIDPRVGEITYRLTQIDRAEPPHELFEVPRDYKIREELSTSSASSPQP